MANWLSRAKSLFQSPSPPPEPFEVLCDCGGKVVGQRTKAYQKPNCVVCQRPVFVLPMNVYPQAKPKASPKKKTVQQPVPIVKNRIAPNEVVDLNSGSGKSAISKSAKSTPELANKVVESALPTQLHDAPKPIMTPLRMIVAAVVLTGSVMVGGLWHRYRVENAKSMVSQAMDAGLTAIKEKEFAKAAVELERARVAVDLIGRHDQAANEIRRLSREVNAIFKLASGSLTEILQSTLATGKTDQTEQPLFSSLDKGAWVIFDAVVLPSKSGKNLYFVDAPIHLEQGKIEIELQTSIFQGLNGDESVGGPRVIFAAQLEQLSAVSGDPPAAVLKLNGTSAFLWTSYETLTAIGYRPFDAESEQQTRTVLEQQLDLQSK